MSKEALKFLDEVIGEKLTFGSMIRTIRLTSYEDINFKEFANMLGISESELDAIEKGIKIASVEQAKHFALVLEDSEKFFLEVLLNS